MIMFYGEILATYPFFYWGRNEYFKNKKEIKMSVKSFKKKFIHEKFSGVSTLEFRSVTDFTSDFLLEKDPKELKYVLRRTLEDLRIQLLSEFDNALMELEKE